MQRKFEFYGPIKRIRIVKDLSGKSRGYAFIEYEHKSDFSNAYKRGDRERIDEKLVYTDFERGRTEKGFKPRRLGGHFPQETRPLPSWLQKDLKNFKDNHAELIEDIKKRYAPVKEIKNENEFELDNKKKDFNANVNNLINNNNDKSRSRSKDRNNKDKDKERARKHRSKSRSRSRSRDKRKNRRNLSPTPKKEIVITNTLNAFDNKDLVNIDENVNNSTKNNEPLNTYIENNNYANQNGNVQEGVEINGNNNIKGITIYIKFIWLKNFILKIFEKLIFEVDYDEDSDFTDRRRSKKDKKEKKDKKHKKDKKSKKDKKEKKEKKEKRERKDSVEVGEII